MKVFISFDMEGVAGIVDWSQCGMPGPPYEEGRRLLLGEVNAAIDGAMAAGAGGREGVDHPVRGRPGSPGRRA